MASQKTNHAAKLKRSGRISRQRWSAFIGTAVLIFVISGCGATKSPEEVCNTEAHETALPRYGRLMHDPQWMAWPSRMAAPDWPSGFHFDWYPETVQLWVRPKGGDGRLPYSRAWLEYLRAIQPNDDAAMWIARVAAGLFNSGNDFLPILDLDQLEKEPVAESISSGGNAVRVLEIRNNSGRVEMLYYKDPPPSQTEVNYLTTPWLVTKFTSISIDGEVGNAGGIDVYFPNLAKQREGYWVDMQRVELFPALPFCGEAREPLPVQRSPGEYGPRMGVLARGQEFVIHEYFLEGSDVWGQTDNGWIRLAYQRHGQPIYPTNWAMETRPPIVFDH